MLLLLAATLAIQVQVRADTTAHAPGQKKQREVSITVGASAARNDTGPHRRPVTPEDLATAFGDTRARDLLLAARAARLRQDSALTSYEATTYERISAGMALRKLARDRLMFRQETATRVRWKRGVGAWVDLTGARMALPLIPPEGQKEASDDMFNDFVSPIPYYPGYEPLISLNDDNRKGIQKTVDERAIVHPLAEGAEAYYTYETGDSLKLRLAGGLTIPLRELRVRPRHPKWNVIVGSFWFDTRSGQLVRAAYRFSAPLDIWQTVKEESPSDSDGVPGWVKGAMSPMTAELSAMTVEYGLYESRFWLPQHRTIEGGVQAGFMHIPLTWAQRFSYRFVNGVDSLPPIAVKTDPNDTLPMEQRMKLRDSLRIAQRDSIKKGLKPKPIAACDTGKAEVRTRRRYGSGDSGVAVAYVVPCDHEALEHSATLPPSIYDPGEETVGEDELNTLRSLALDMSAQARFGPQAPKLDYGLALMRYNRVEGFSAGIGADEELGAGYSAHALARLGVADLTPNFELRVERTNLERTARLGAYTHLVSANDWGEPLSFGSSVGALVLGRDDGFYYRTAGVEFGGSSDDRAHLDWRVFVEHESPASVNTHFALSSPGGHAFGDNIGAWKGTWTGFAMRLDHSYGLDPLGLRVLTTVRTEAAASDSVYGRGAADVTVSHGLGGRTVGAVTLSLGSSVGALPPQRMWYLGGVQTVRGETADPLAGGTAYWLTRTEVGRDWGIIRPTVFADFGWTGDRNRWRDVGRPMSGAGVGASFMDGMLRLDLARGIYPRQQFRLDLSVESRF